MTFLIGGALMLSSFIFIILETIYFGNNILPGSLAELICDGVGLLGCSIGAALFTHGLYGKRMEEK